MRQALAILAVLSMCSAALRAHAESEFRLTDKPGTYAVGLQVVEQYDFTRTYRRIVDELGSAYLGERARPLQTLVWYPSEESSGKPMTLGDYVRLAATETSFGHPRDTRVAAEWRSALGESLMQKLRAIRGATPLRARFPVVIYAPGGSDSAWENVDLCEYLAGHGYVVLATPNLGTSSRSITVDLAGAEAKPRDISFLIGFAKTLPYANPN
jgi:hypothetical protein